jgi:hypothetical protein
MPVDDSELKARLLLAAGHGWTKPASGTPVGDRLAGFLDALGPDHDPAFAGELQAVRKDWLSGPGVSLAGALHHGVWSAPPDPTEPGPTPGP